MFDIPDLMRVAQDLARHASARQAVIAENIAQANTPGFRARDLPAFGAQTETMHLAATRPAHLNADRSPPRFAPQIDRGAPSFAPNGNTVSLEREMMRAVQTRQSHEMALATYSSARNILRSALGQ